MNRSALLVSFLVLVACGGSSSGGPPGTGQDLTDIGLARVEANPPHAVADGDSAITLVVTVDDVKGNPTEGANVSFAALGPQDVLTPKTASTDSNGTAVFHLTSTVANAKSLLATIEKDGNTLELPAYSVWFDPGPPAASWSSVAVDPTWVHADGEETTRATLTIRDAYGNPCHDVPVTPSITGAEVSSWYNGEASSNDDGEFTLSLKSTVAAQKLVHFAFAGLQLDAPVTFHPNAWSVLGPDDANVHTLVLASSSPLRLLVGTNGAGVFVSTDGSTWERTWVALPEKNVTSLAVSNDGTAAYAVTPTTLSGDELWVSTDAGKHWEGRLANMSLLKILGVGPDDAVYISTSNGLQRSLDHGATWIAPDASMPANVRQFVFGWPSFALAGGSIYKSADGVRGWTAIGTSGLPTGGVDLFAVDPNNASRIFASRDYTLYKTTDSGNSWTQMNIGGLPVNMSQLIVDSVRSNTLYANGSYFTASTDDGTSFLPSASLGSYASSVVITASGDLYAATPDSTGFSLQRSTDAASSWTPAGKRLSNVGIDQLAVSPDGSSAMTIVGVTLFSSTDWGATWTGGNGTLDGQIVPSAVATDFHTGQSFVGGRDYADSADSVYARESGGWTSLGSPPLTVQHLTAPGNGKVYAWNENGTFCWSAISGGTWSCAGNSSLWPLEQLVVDPVHENLYALSSGSLSVSTDLGLSWNPIDAGRYVQAIAVDPNSPDNLAVADDYGIIVSRDRGQTWSEPHGDASNGYSQLAFDPSTSDANTLYVINYGVLSKSTDGGLSWTRISSGMFGQAATVLAIPASSPSTLYLGTEAGGIFGATNGGI